MNAHLDTEPIVLERDSAEPIDYYCGNPQSVFVFKDGIQLGYFYRPFAWWKCNIELLTMLAPDMPDVKPYAELIDKILRDYETLGQASKPL